MSKKTKRVHRRHKRNRTNKRHRTNKHRINHRRHTRTHLYRKRREIVSLPGSQSIPLFSAPEKKHTQRIYVNKSNSFGNMIPGLRNMR